MSNSRNSRGLRPLIRGVEHIAIATTEPRRRARWYIQYLNFEPLLDTGNTVYIKSANSVVLEFVKAENVPPKPQIRDAGMRLFFFRDLEGDYLHLVQQEIPFDT